MTIWLSDKVSCLASFKSLVIVSISSVFAFSITTGTGTFSLFNSFSMIKEIFTFHIQLLKTPIQHQKYPDRQVLIVCSLVSDYFYNIIFNLRKKLKNLKK
jgi:hypothetical protein